jgi:hypothetical protein
MGLLGAQPILPKPNLVEAYPDTLTQFARIMSHVSGDVVLVSMPLLNV